MCAERRSRVIRPLGRLAALLTLVLWLGSGTATAQSPNLGAYHALVIGNQAYRYVKPLTTPVADATAVADLLQRDYRFKVRLLTNVTRVEMVRALDELRRTLGEHDNLLVYYAGHGWLDRESDRGYWLPVDAEQDTRANWLSNADITDTLKALRAKHVVVVADSCYSGTLARSIGVQPLAPADLLRLAQKKARTVLTSGGLEPVADVGGGTHSVFARAFLNALRGNPGAADLTSLFAGIRRQVLLNAEQTPEYAEIRLAGHEGGDFIFVRPGATLALAPLPAPAPPPAPERLADEQKRLAEERARLDAEKRLLEEQRRVQEERERVEAEKRALEAERQRLAALPKPDVVVRTGNYRVQGTNPNGSRYSGTLTLDRSGSLYLLHWKIGRDTFHGQGTLSGRTLTIDWGQPDPVIYQVMSDGTLDGTWAKGQGKETLFPEP